MGTPISSMTETGSAPSDSYLALAYDGANYKIAPGSLASSSRSNGWGTTDWVACNDPAYYGPPGGVGSAFSGWSALHGLSEAPQLMQVQFQCTGAEYGYTSGDMINVHGSMDDTRNGTAWADATGLGIGWYPKNIFLRVLDRTDGYSIYNADPEKWLFRIVYA